MDTSCGSSSKSSSKGSVFRYLPLGYQPGEFDVLCGRGRRCYFHSGNEHFRAFVQSMIPNYSSATSKIEKGYILSVIVQKIRDRAGIGGFIKQDNKGQWFEVGDFLAREKVSQAFRDFLSSKYKSSTAYKKMRREVEQNGEIFDPARHSSSSLEILGSTSSEPVVTVKQKSEKPAPQPTLPNQSMKRESTFHDALLGPLDQDLHRQFQSSSVFSSRNDKVCLENADLFEPTPLPGPNPHQRQGHQDRDYSDFHSCPDMPVKPAPSLPEGFQHLDLAQLMFLSAQQQGLIQL